MKILVELEDASPSTCSHLEERLLEELTQLLGPRGFNLKQLEIVNQQTTKKGPEEAPTKAI